MQQPKSLTRFLCWSFAINITSFLNSSIPCLELLDSLFTATCCPLDNWPWIHDPKLSLVLTISSKQLSSMPQSNSSITYVYVNHFPVFTHTIMEIEKERKICKISTFNDAITNCNFTLKTEPKPPCPSLLIGEKLSVAATMQLRSKINKSGCLLFLLQLISLEIAHGTSKK